MYRIIDGILLEGKISKSQHDVRIWEANGHREVSVMPVIEWHDIGMVSKEAEYKPDPLREEEDAEERRAANLKRAAGRAKTQCRRFIKLHGFRELLTLTYRDNQTDEKLFKDHFAKWVRRMKAALGGTFDYCAGFETQKRGAWHAHVACQKMPTWVVMNKGKATERTVASWKLGTQIWRSVVGTSADGKDGGMCFVGGKKRKNGRKPRVDSVGAMASYVSKYITKHYEEMGEGTNRYSRSNGEVAKPITMRVQGDLADAIAEAFMCFPGEIVLSSTIGRYGDSYWLATEPKPDRRNHEKSKRGGQ
jgi:hypothetical protein